MSDPTSSPLRDAVRDLLTRAVDEYRGSVHEPGLATCLTRIDDPLRVAIAGRIKAGKSTLLNAIVRERVAATDAGECTRVVTWYTNGLQYRAWAYPRGKDPIQIPFSRTNHETVPDLGPAGLNADDLDRLRVEFPSSALSRLQLVDTPGIGSISTDVSAKTFAFLQADDDRPREVDAVLYLMRHIHSTDVGFLEAFHDEEFVGTLPVNAIGVLSRADEIGSGRVDALDLSRKIALDYRGDPRVRRLVQTVIPVSALLAQAAATMRQLDFESFGALAALSLDDLDALTISTDHFLAAAGSPIPVDTHRELLDRFGMFGVRLAIALIRHRLVTSAPQLARELERRSGLPELRDVLGSQFTERADVLKAHAALNAVKQALDTNPVRSLRALRERVSAHAQLDFDQLELLNQLRLGTFEDDIEPDLRVEMETMLGADGGAPAVRLGLDPDVPPAAVRDEALRCIEFWQEVSESPRVGRAQRDRKGSDAMTLRQVAATMRQSAERLYFALPEAG